MIHYIQPKTQRIDEKNGENLNHFCGKLFFIMCKNSHNSIKALLLKDIPLGGCRPLTKK
jgi:hypothetical protein